MRTAALYTIAALLNTRRCVIYQLVVKAFHVRDKPRLRLHCRGQSQPKERGAAELARVRIGPLATRGSAHSRLPRHRRVCAPGSQIAVSGWSNLHGESTSMDIKT